MLFKRISAFAQGIALSCAFVPALWAPPASANLSGATMGTYATQPIEIVQNVPPLVMLTMSRDHQYFLEAYNDFTDLDGQLPGGDVLVERTYKDSFKYYGYFHSGLCYRYVDADARFNPVGAAGGTNKHYCEGTLDDAWSGNFLNWASMTRMDIVRKILYGGYRSTDTSSATVLERAHLPNDAHAFVKYYNGTDLAKLVPFNSLKVDAANGGDNDGVDDADEGISICNVSWKAAGSSQGTTSTTPTETPNPAPMLRVARKNYQLWTANEVRQCTWENENGDGTNGNNAAASGINAGTSDPPDSDALRTPSNSRDHIARVKVCDPTYVDVDNNLENCKAYGTNYKPEGLLQKYGLDGQIKFGLITGSYRKNLSGGVLRKNVGTLADEVNVTNGTFIAKTGTQPGIIRTLNAMRIYGYSYDGGTYFGTNSGDNCSYQQTSFTNGKCRSWGNPMSEIYMEAIRYFKVSGGRAPTNAFMPDASGDTGGAESALIAGLVTDSWATDPLNSDNFCAALNTVVFNASVSSYDDDQTGSSDILDLAGVKAATKAIGDGEGITGNDYFIGRSGASTNEMCSAKVVASLGDSFGLCPEAPTLTGSYHMAGLAHYAKTHDLRTSTSFIGDQTVTTYAVSLATSTPVINAYLGPEATGTSVVRILPAYRLRAGGNNTNEALNNPSNDGAGSMVDYKIIRPHTQVVSATDLTASATNTGFYHGKFWMNWEDSEQGGDFDQDVWGTYEYLVNTNVSPNTVTVTTNLVSGISGGFPQLFGFVISGTTKDGFHAYSGYRATVALPGGANFTDPTGVKGCVACASPGNAAPGAGSQTGAQSYTFTVGTDPAGVLESPLFYAAKWGGFTDSNGNNKPDLKSEWDIKDQSGNEVPGGDGFPDNYFFVTNPAALETSLATIFNTILERVSSGTSAAVVANDRVGTGAMFQAIYDPVKRDSRAAGNHEVKWIGTLHALWVDSEGLIREDAGVKGKLEGYQTDQVISLEYNDTLRRTQLVRLKSAKDDTYVANGAEAAVELNKLKPIWNAREQLSNLPDDTIEQQREYDTAATDKRFIFTWMDADTDGVPDDNEVLDFVSNNIDAGNFMWLDADNVAAAQRLVDWTRGKESGMTEFRSRVVDYDGDEDIKTEDGNLEVMRLGDIVHSTPIAVSTPAQDFDLLMNDASYREFREYYRKRRQVVYVGGNDGMIHAFNAGFFDSTTKTFDTTRVLDDGGSDAPEDDTKAVEHPLGAEIWAYVPKNLLPHLQWSARKDYSHVYMVDNASIAFDAKIFDKTDPDYPEGWGTVLVATMRYGGGSDETGILVDTGQDGKGVANADNDTRDDVKTKSAIVILDITNPEKPPRVLAELTPPNLQHTTSVPALAVIANPSGSSPNKWYLVAGSGASNLTSASYTSGGSLYPQVFVYDLANLDKGLDDVSPSSLAGLVRVIDLEATTAQKTDAFIGDMAGYDFDFNLKTDAVYFGTVGRASDTDGVNQGTLYRLTVGEKEDAHDWANPFPLLENVNQPFVKAPLSLLDKRQRRWVVAASGRFEATDDRTTQDKQTLYGFIDANSNTSENATPVDDFVNTTNARSFSNGISLNGDTVVEYASAEALTDEIVQSGGWKRDFENGSFPAERGVSGVGLAGTEEILIPAYKPDSALCTSEGSSVLLGLSFLTGAPPGVFGSVPCDGCAVDEVVEYPATPVKNVGTVDEPVYEPVEYRGKLEVPAVSLSSSGMRTEDEDKPDDGRACGITSVASIQCTDIQLRERPFNGEISWREHRNAQ